MDKETDANPKLSDLFSLAEPSIEELERLAETETLEALGHELEKQVKGRLKTEVLIEQLVAQLPTLLDIELLDILASACAKSTDLSQYADPDRYPPEETVMVPIVEHSVVSTHEPKLDIRINEISLGEVTFGVNVELSVEGVILRIQGGRIRSIKIGSCQASGAITLGPTAQPIFERETQPLEFPATIDLGEGIEIRPADPNRDEG